MYKRPVCTCVCLSVADLGGWFWPIFWRLNLAANFRHWRLILTHFFSRLVILAADLGQKRVLKRAAFGAPKQVDSRSWFAGLAAPFFRVGTCFGAKIWVYVSPPKNMLRKSLKLIETWCTSTYELRTPENMIRITASMAQSCGNWCWRTENRELLLGWT